MFVQEESKIWDTSLMRFKESKFEEGVRLSLFTQKCALKGYRDGTIQTAMSARKAKEQDI